MGRLHLLELEDQPWFPSVLRDAGTAFLEFAARLSKQGEVLAPILREALRRGQEDRIVDLCSGGSGPLPATLEALEAGGMKGVSATLTDLYPNENAFRKISRENEAIEARYEPVDATALPEDLKGLRTLFSGFHHFEPAPAKRILENAVADRAPIAVIEVVARHPLAILGIGMGSILAFFSIPFLRPFRWSWLPLTYLVPVIPLFILWDGFVSCLRCYSQRELRALIAEIPTSDYEWEVGAIDIPGAPYDGTYLIGSPRPTAAPPAAAMS